MHTNENKPFDFEIAEAIQRELDQANERGQNSADRTLKALKKMPQIKSILKTKRWSRPDLKKRDLIVELDEVSLRKLFSDYQINKIQHVFIQVKSSNGGIAGFREKLGKTSAEQQHWLISNRLIVINGQQTFDEIQADFLAQLQTVVAAHLRTNS